MDSAFVCLRVWMHVFKYIFVIRCVHFFLDIWRVRGSWGRFIFGYVQNWILFLKESSMPCVYTAHTVPVFCWREDPNDATFARTCNQSALCEILYPTIQCDQLDILFWQTNKNNMNRDLFWLHYLIGLSKVKTFFHTKWD